MIKHVNLNDFLREERKKKFHYSKLNETLSSNENSSNLYHDEANKNVYNSASKNQPHKSMFNDQFISKNESSEEEPEEEDDQEKSGVILCLLFKNGKLGGAYYANNLKLHNVSFVFETLMKPWNFVISGFNA